MSVVQEHVALVCVPIVKVMKVDLSNFAYSKIRLPLFLLAAWQSSFQVITLALQTSKVQELRTVCAKTLEPHSGYMYLYSVMC